MRKHIDDVADCTPKAISHRLTKWRTPKESSGEAGEEGNTTPKPKPAKANKAATAPKGKGKGKKAAAETKTTPPPTEEGEEGLVTPPDTATKKRAGSKRKSKSPTASADEGGADNDEPVTKKIKVEENAGDEAGAEGEVEGDEGIGA